MLKLPGNINSVTRQDIPTFKEALKPHLPIVRTLVKVDRNIVFRAELTKADNRMLSATVGVFRSQEVTSADIIHGNYVKVVTDWMDKKHLWFKMKGDEVDIFIDYIDQYRDTFQVDTDKPQVIFTVKC